MADSKHQKTSNLKETIPVAADKRKEDKDLMTKVKCHSNGALSKKLGAFFNDSHFHDVILKLPKGREFKAHRLVLCVWSGYFKEKLQGPSRSRAPSTLELKDLTDGECKAFEHLLRFMYTGEVTPHDDNVLDICRLTEKFQVKDLRHLCEEWIGNNIGDHNVIGASARLRDAEKLGLYHLTEKCREIFCHYFTRLPESTWNSLSSDHVEEILKSSEVVVQDEYHVLKKLETWLNSNGGIEKQKTILVERLLPQIRFRFMSAVQLKHVREGPMGELFKESLPGILEDAFEFRAVSGEQSKVLGSREEGEKELNSTETYKSPRLYYDFDFAGVSQTVSQTRFKSFRISSYSESRSVIVFNKDGHCWRDSREWRIECKAFQDSSSKDDPWRLKFVLSVQDRVQRGYHVAFLIRESRNSNPQLAANQDMSEPELLVLVGKGVLTKEDESDYTKKITLVTPPIFDKNPREIDLCFVGNCFMN